MKKKLIILFTIMSFSSLDAKDNLIFFINSALEKNPKINAERKNLNSVKQNINISKVNFYRRLQLLVHKQVPRQQKLSIKQVQ